MASSARGIRWASKGALALLLGSAVAIGVWGVGVSSASRASAGANSPGKLNVPVLKVGNGHSANMSLEAPGGKPVPA